MSVYSEPYTEFIIADGLSKNVRFGIAQLRGARYQPIPVSRASSIERATWAAAFISASSIRSEWIGMKFRNAKPSSNTALRRQ